MWLVDSILVSDVLMRHSVLLLVHATDGDLTQPVHRHVQKTLTCCELASYKLQERLQWSSQGGTLLKEVFLRIQWKVMWSKAFRTWLRKVHNFTAECTHSFSVKFEDRYAIVCHSASQKHKVSKKQWSQRPQITSFFTKKDSTQEMFL